MRNLGIALALLVVGAVPAAADDAKPVDPPASAEPAPAPVAPRLLDGTPRPKEIAAHDSHRDADHLGGRECAPNAMGQIECKVPAPTTGPAPSHPTSSHSR